MRLQTSIEGPRTMSLLPIRSRSNLLGRAVITAVAATVLFGAAADARCTRLGFSVNDYGKDGPTNDAKKLLDTYIAKWASDNGIKKYTTGKKNVTCELYLDVGLFDEHTCKAEASVCWEGGPAVTTTPVTPAGSVAKPAKASPKPAATQPKTAPATPATKPDAPKAKAASLE
jgi:hypothetical protein